MHIPSNIPSSAVSRSVRGSSLPAQSSAKSLKYPQQVVPVSKGLVSSFACLSSEPEDAKITGATRSLSRRLLALSMPPAN